MGPKFILPQRTFDPQNEFDVLIKEAEGAINGYQTTYPDQFEEEVAAVENNEELSPLGKRRAFKRLVDKYENHLEGARLIADPWIGRAEAEAARLEGVLNKRPFVEPQGTQAEQTAELIDRANRKHRSLLDFRQLGREQKHEVIWGALDKAPSSASARELLQNLSEDGLLSDGEEKRARMVIRRVANPDVVRAHEELVGGVDHTGEPDPERPGALTIAKMSRDNYRSYLRERTGVGLSLDQLAEQHAVTRPMIDERAIRLSRAAASNAEIFRAAQAEAEAKGLSLEVEPIQQAPFGIRT
jgi:hypothetical protein